MLKTYHDWKDCEPLQFHYEAEETVTNSEPEMIWNGDDINNDDHLNIELVW